MKKILNLNMIQTLIDGHVEYVYDNRERKIPLVRLMYERLYDIVMQIKDGQLFYDPDDLMR